MRRVVLAGTLVALLAALFAMWAYRYERLPGLPVWSLADLRDETPPTPGVEFQGDADQPKLRLRALSGGPSLAIRLAIPGAPAVDGLHLRFRMAARGLIPGRERWQDGRIMVEWHHPEGASERDSVGSIQEDGQSGWEEMVVQPDRVPAIPTLRLEHLGRAGEFELSELELTAVRERSLWKIGRWFLAAGWLAWGAAAIHSWPGISRMRAICAAAIWVALGTQFVIPGPWKIQRPMVPAFQLGEIATGHSPQSMARAADPVPPSSVVDSGPLEALGKLPHQGSLVLRVKLAVSKARPLLHAFLLFAPTVAFAWLAGRRPALFLAVALAVSIELAQIAFGYGFDIVDLGDLASDAAGIGLALWLHGRFVARQREENHGFTQIHTD